MVLIIWHTYHETQGYPNITVIEHRALHSKTYQIKLRKLHLSPLRGKTVEFSPFLPSIDGWARFKAHTEANVDRDQCTLTFWFI